MWWCRQDDDVLDQDHGLRPGVGLGEGDGSRAERQLDVFKKHLLVETMRLADAFAVSDES